MNEEEVNTYAARYVEECLLTGDIDFADVAEFLGEEGESNEDDWELVYEVSADIVQFLRDRVDLYFER